MKRIKRQADLIAKKFNLPHHESLEFASKLNGYKDWHQANKELSKWKPKRIYYVYVPQEGEPEIRKAKKEFEIHFQSTDGFYDSEWIRKEIGCQGGTDRLTFSHDQFVAICNGNGYYDGDYNNIKVRTYENLDPSPMPGNILILKNAEPERAEKGETDQEEDYTEGHYYGMTRSEAESVVYNLMRCNDDIQDSFAENFKNFSVHKKIQMLEMLSGLQVPEYWDSVKDDEDV